MGFGGSPYVEVNYTQIRLNIFTAVPIEIGPMCSMFINGSIWILRNPIPDPFKYHRFGPRFINRSIAA